MSDQWLIHFLLIDLIAFLPPSQHNGGEWTSVCGVHSIEISASNLRTLDNSWSLQQSG